MTHAERACKRYEELRGMVVAFDTMESYINIIRAIEETRDVQESHTTPEVVRRVPQPLTRKEFDDAGWIGVLNLRLLQNDGLGIYRISDVEEACK